MSHDGPTKMGQSEIKDEIIMSRCAIGLSAVMASIATAAGTVRLVEVLNTTEAQELGVADALQAGVPAAIALSATALGISNVRAFRKRLEQAHVNDRLSGIARANDIKLNAE